MGLTTGTPLGTIETGEEIWLDSAPYIYYQDATAGSLKNPDSNGFYWGLSGTATYNVFELGCVNGVSLTEGLTMNDVMCDQVGFKNTVMQRNYIELNFTLQQFFPFQSLSPIMKGSSVTEDTVNHQQAFGLGKINNNQFYHVYCPMVYDTDVGDYVMFHLHRARFIDAWTLNMSYGTPWQLTNVKFRAFADTSKPEIQKFGVFLRSDLSVIV
jgi:hypothetical protein